MRAAWPLAFALLCGFGGPAAAQAPPFPATPGAAWPADVLRDLPTGGNVFSVLETMQPETVTDRFNSGGINAGERARTSALSASWSQTQYRIGDISIASPVDGTPLVFPEIDWWDRVDVATGLMPPYGGAPGLAVSLSPRRPAPGWHGVVEGSASGSALTAAASTTRPPPIAQLLDSTSGRVRIGGHALNARLPLTIGGAWLTAATRERGSDTLHHQRVASAFANATYYIRADRVLRTLALVQSSRVPFPLAAVYRQPSAETTDRAVHVQSTFEQRWTDSTAWRVFGGYTARSREDRWAPVPTIAADRLADGPIPSLITEAERTERRWTVGARVSPRWSRPRHGLEFGGAVEGLHATGRRAYVGTIEERVDGVPARLWQYTNPGTGSARGATRVSAFARDRLSLSSSAVVDAALAFDSADGRARDAVEGISWRSWLPSARLTWDLGTPLHLRFVTGAGRSANQPLLGLLEYGDPVAPVARVFRWDGVSAVGPPLVARVGPGTGGDPAFSTIDPDLRAPVTSEFAIGLQAHPKPALWLSVFGLARRESSLVNVVNVGAPAESYTVFTIPDANADLVGAADDQQLPVYNRKPESFAQDRYVLTNPGQDAATMGAVIVMARIATRRLFLQIGGTAFLATGSGGNRGFRPTENDPDMTGELFTNPNAGTYARGRLFNDRAYTIKWTTVYQLPWDMRLGAIARYQDGQPFSRMVVVSGLNQGTEVIQAFANGRSRFAFTGTLDVRLQKAIVAGPIVLHPIVDAYNLLNTSKEVEEYVVTGPRFRETTAVQPPRAVHLGLRVSF